MPKKVSLRGEILVENHAHEMQTRAPCLFRGSVKKGKSPRIDSLFDRNFHQKLFTQIVRASWLVLFAGAH
jgi:hypothetical protein